MASEAEARHHAIAWDEGVKLALGSSWTRSAPAYEVVHRSGAALAGAGCGPRRSSATDEETMWPIPGRPITSAYGKKGTYWKACGWHTGADIAAPQGTPILAPIARHDPVAQLRQLLRAQPVRRSALLRGSRSRIEEFFVAHTIDRLPDGTEVRAGQHIARVGADGNATGPHGHFERHRGKGSWSCGVMLNPQAMFDWQPTSAPSPTPSPQPEEDAEMNVILINYKGDRYACYPSAGVKRRIGSPKQETNIANITEKAGGRVIEWSAGKDVEDPDAFGLTIT